MSDEPRKRSCAWGCLAVFVVLVLLLVFWPVILMSLIFALAALQATLETLVWWFRQ